MAWIWAILCVSIFLHLSQKLLTRKKKMPPGPRGLPILGHLHLLGKNPHHSLCHLARKYGPIMSLRLGFVPAVVISSPAAAELVLKTHGLVFAGRPSQEAVKYMGYGQRGIVFSPYSPYVRNMRKLFTTELMTSLRINQFMGSRKAELGLLLESLKQAAGRREIVDLGTKIFCLTGDMNFLMLFGRKSADTNMDENDFKFALTEALELAAKFNLADYFPFVGLLDLQRMKNRMKRLIKIFDGFLEKFVEDHVQKEGKKQAEGFVDIMLEEMESGKAEFQFDRRHIKAVLLDLLIAGTDAPASAIEWGLTELIRHPQAMKKLQKELELVVGLDNVVEESHLDKLEYLNFVVKETLRLHPSVPLLVPHESTEDCILEGFHIREKSRILVNAWAVGRDPNVWENPEEFSPERFSCANIEFKGLDFRLLAFGVGRRSCPGMPVGVRMVKFVVAQLVHCFDWELPDNMDPSDLDMSEHFGIGTCKAEHLMAIPIYRLRK